MKVLISIDYEGATGVVHWQEPVDIQKRAMTEDAIALARGLSEHSVIITDAHAAGRNLFPEQLPQNCELIRGGPRPLGMMEGVDLADCVILAGYHAGIGSPKGLMDHTFSSSTVYRMTLNSRKMNEALINAYLAGYFKRPVIMATGDDVLVESLKDELDPGVEYVITKYGISRFAARLRPAQEVRTELTERARAAAAKATKIRPLIPEPPYNLRIAFHDTVVADLVELLPEGKRISGREIEFEDQDFLKIYRLLRLSLGLGITARYYREK